MNETMTGESLFNSDKNTFPEYTNLGMTAVQLILLLFYGFLKLKKRVANNEARLQSMRNRLNKITEL